MVVIDKNPNNMVDEPVISVAEMFFDFNSRQRAEPHSNVIIISINASAISLNSLSQK